MEHSLDNESLREWYRQRGFGGRVGFGQRPALLVIDIARGWLDPTTSIGSDQKDMLDNILAVLRAARAAELPVIFTTMGGLGDSDEVFDLKLPGSSGDVRKPELMELEPSLERAPHEPLLVKPRQSAFFGTRLVGQLIGLSVDTVIVVGASTSGCIRSTCEDAFNNNLRVIVPRGAVGDRSPSAHEANLFDIDNRFGDVVGVAEVLAQLETMHAGGALASSGRGDDVQSRQRGAS